MVVVDGGGSARWTIFYKCKEIHRDIEIYFPHQSYALPFDLKKVRHSRLTGVY